MKGSTARRLFCALGALAAVVPAPLATAATAGRSAPGTISKRLVDVATLPATSQTNHPALPRRTPARGGASSAAPGSARSTGPPQTVSVGTNGFAGDSFSQQTTVYGRGQDITPPDNGTAANGAYVVEFLNSSGWAYLRNDGGVGAVKSWDLNAFFVAPADISAGFFESDARMVWDPQSSRWFASALSFQCGNNTCTQVSASKEYVAISMTADPTGVWTVYTIASLTNELGDQERIGITSDKVVVFWDDYPGLTSGYDGEEGYALLKSDMVAGVTAHAHHFGRNVAWFGVVPAYDTAGSDAFAVFNDSDPNLTTVSGQHTADGKVHLVDVSGTPTAGSDTTTIASDTALTPSSATSCPGSAGTCDITAPQPGGSSPLIDADDDRVTVAQISGSTLWASADTTCTIATVVRDCVRMFKFTTGGSPALTDVNIGQAGEYFYYGAPVIDASGNVAVIMSRSSGTAGDFPSVYMSGAASGTTSFSTPAVVHGGANSYADSAFCSKSGSPCRWGDYSSGAPDPCDGAFGWTSAEFAGAPADDWATWIAPVTFGAGTTPALCAGAPTITSVSPSPAAASSPVTITGTNFTGATHVYFGATSATFSVTDSMHISATVPAGSGTVDVSVVTPSGDSGCCSSTDQFSYTFVSPPTVSSVSPTSAPADGSTSVTVTVTGTNFTYPATVQFGAVGSRQVNSGSSGSLMVSSPTTLTAQMVDVQVTASGQTSAVNRPGDEFTYTPATTVSSVSPATAPADGSTTETVTVTGTNFAYPATVHFGAVGSQVVSSGTATSLSVTSPASATAQVVDVKVADSNGTSPTTPVDEFAYVDGGLTMDAYGGLHPFAVTVAPPSPAGGPYWAGWKIARGLAVRKDRASGYVLDGWGGVHNFGAAPAVSQTTYWPGWDIARGIVLDPCDATGTSGYVVDGWGGVHAFGGAPAVNDAAYWPGWDIVRGIAMNPCGHGGYTLDGWGGVHPFGGAPAPGGNAYWPGWDIARGIMTTATGMGYTVDGWGGVHPFGGAPAPGGNAYWPGWDIARGIASVPGSGIYVLDGWGGVHPVSGAPGVTISGYTQGNDLFRALQ